MRLPSSGALRTQVGTPAGCSSRLWMVNADYRKTGQHFGRCTQSIPRRRWDTYCRKRVTSPGRVPFPFVLMDKGDTVRPAPPMFIGQASTRRVASGRLSQRGAFWGRRRTL